MAGIKHLRNISDRKGKEFLDNLLNGYVIINQNIKGNFFGVKKDRSSDEFKYFKKSGQITYVDQMLMKYYNPAIKYFQSLDLNKRNRIPANFFFGFEYITVKDGSNAGLNRRPKNDLILSYIQKLDDNGNVIETLQSKDQLSRWAAYLGVEAPQVIFEGKLDSDQKTSILEFVYATHDDLVEKFKTTSFTKYILSILNDDSGPDFFKNRIGKDIESIIFRFYDDDSNVTSYLAKLIDPIFEIKGKGETPKSKSNDYIWLIVIDLMNFIELYNDGDLRTLCADETDYDKKYIKLINSIYKDFLKEYKIKYEGLELDIPEYLNRPEFDVDFNLVEDAEIVDLIKNNETYKEIYRILLNFFRKVRKRTSSSFFSKEMLTQLNIQVKKLKRIVMGDFVYEGLFPSFGEFIGEDITVNSIIESTDDFVKTRKEKGEKVNIMIGSFQPIHNGHIKAIEKLKEKNGLRTVLISVMKPNKNYPISQGLVTSLLNRVQQHSPETVAAVKVISQDTIREILGELQPKWEPVLWGSDSRKIKDYVLQLDFIKKKNIPIRLSDEFQLVELPTYQKSEEVRDVIKDQDFEKFRSMVPSSISSEFFNLNKELTNDQ